MSEKTLTDRNGVRLQEGDVVMMIRKTPNKFGRKICRAYLVVKPRCTKWLELAMTYRGCGFERAIPRPTEDNYLTRVGTADEIDHDLSRSVWAEAYRRTNEMKPKEAAGK